MTNEPRHIVLSQECLQCGDTLVAEVQSDLIGLWCLGCGYSRAAGESEIAEAENVDWAGERQWRAVDYLAEPAHAEHQLDVMLVLMGRET